MIEATEHAAATTQWVCMVCNWIYDPAVGSPEHGIPAGTAFNDIPDDWYCPECGVTKADFEPIQF
ncbi:MAG: rubredoxin [Betaproteobacteria bacterium]|nr:rubredoxin [Betaproteobacteria bacterium]